MAMDENDWKVMGAFATAFNSSSNTSSVSAVTRQGNVTTLKPTEIEANFSRLDIRVGKIVDIEKHPDADTLYIEKVDLGEETPRTIISALVNHVPIEEMRNRSALFLVNLKPVKMRDVLSEGMLMCAKNEAGKIEILIPPHAAQPGDFVTVDGYERKPDTRINTKKKAFVVIQENLKTNDKKEATYKGIPWNVADKGPVLSLTLANASIC